jgi:hypothetical protein
MPFSGAMLGTIIHRNRDVPATARVARPDQMRRSALGHEERFPPTRLSAGCGFRKETIAGMRGNDEVAPIAAVPAIMV